MEHFILAVFLGVGMEILIKPMVTDEEMSGKGHVHYIAWQEAYSGLVSSEYLSNMTEEKCIFLARKWQENILIAKEGERVIGFVGVGNCQDEATVAVLGKCFEIYSLYVLSEYYGRGVGYALMKAAFGRISNCKKVVLWVLRGNERAIKFYKRYGFRFDGEEKEIELGGPLTELRMVYEREW